MLAATLRPLALALAALAPLLGAAAGSAQEQSEPDAARLTAARALVAALGGRDQASSTVDRLRSALIANIQSQQPAKAVGFAAYAEKVMAPDGDIVGKYLGDVESLAVNFYARRFSAEELAAITAFQTSPAGRKFQAVTPELGQQIAARTMQLQGEVIRRIEQGAAGATGEATPRPQ